MYQSMGWLKKWHISLAHVFLKNGLHGGLRRRGHMQIVIECHHIKCVLTYTHLYMLTYSRALLLDNIETNRNTTIIILLCSKASCNRYDCFSLTYTFQNMSRLQTFMSTFTHKIASIFYLTFVLFLEHVIAIQIDAGHWLSALINMYRFR